MPTIKSVYVGELRTKNTHLKSGTEIITDAPIDNHGKGEAFSPTDLVASALGSCMMTTMGIFAQHEGLELKSMSMDITKVMSDSGQRKIAEIHIKFDFSTIFLTDEHQIKLKTIALHCPVAISLDPAIKQVVDFGF